MADNWKQFETMPTPQELKEEGYFQTAKVDLMRNQGRAALNHFEEMANENGYELVKKRKEATEYAHDLEAYPIESIMTEGAFGISARGHGKTNLMKLLTMQALKRGVKVKVIDSTLQWKRFPLKTVKVQRKTGKIVCELNRVYDVARLSVLEIRQFVSMMMERDFAEAVALTDIGRKPSLLYVIEEVQNVVLPNSLRTLKFQEISRFVTQGRNFGLSFLCSTQRLASTDANMPEISGVKFWGKLEGENNLRKARAWLPKFTVWRLRDLEVGQFYLQIGSKVKLLRLPKFEAKEVINADMLGYHALF